MTGRRRAGTILPRTAYARPTLDVARDLLGSILVHRSAEGRTSGRIVEVEAYIGETDPACHASRGFTPRTATLYGPPGRAYVYFTYGMHELVNAVTERDGYPAAVLLRALEPLEGLSLMHARRGPLRDGRPRAADDLCRGPGNLAKAMGISRAHNTLPLARPPKGDGVWIEAGAAVADDDVIWTPRIGIREGMDRLWRAYVRGCSAVSATRAREVGSRK